MDYMPFSLESMVKKRLAVEPMVGRVKNNEGSNGNYLLGQKGDRVSGILCGVEHNALKLCSIFLFPYFLSMFI
jgi:hypothetical protein